MVRIAPADLAYEARQRVMNWFFSFPTRGTTLTELVRHTRVAKTTASSIVEEFIEEGFLRKQVVGNAWRITVNPDHDWNRTLKVVRSLEQISSSGLVNAIKEEYPQAKAIVLFGSYRRGTDREDSDIDIAVEIAGDRPVQIERFATFTRINFRTGIPVNLLVFTRKHVDLNVFNSIANGIVLDGFLEVRP